MRTNGHPEQLSFGPLTGLNDYAIMSNVWLFRRLRKAPAPSSATAKPQKRSLGPKNAVLGPTLIKDISMIGFKIRHLACVLILFILATPLFADVIVTEKGIAGDLRWWSDQVVIRHNTIYFLGHKQNTSSELDYKLYVVDTNRDIKSDIVH